MGGVPAGPSRVDDHHPKEAYNITTILLIHFGPWNKNLNSIFAHFCC